MSMGCASSCWEHLIVVAGRPPPTSSSLSKWCSIIIPHVGRSSPSSLAFLGGLSAAMQRDVEKILEAASVYILTFFVHPRSSFSCYFSIRHVIRETSPVSRPFFFFFLEVVSRWDGPCSKRYISQSSEQWCAQYVLHSVSLSYVIGSI